MTYVFAMKSDLRNLMSAQEEFRAEHRVFGNDLGRLHFTSSVGVRIVIEHADSGTWRARATHSSHIGTCTVEGGPQGSGLHCYPDFADLRAGQRGKAHVFYGTSALLWLLALIDIGWHRRAAGSAAV